MCPNKVCPEEGRRDSNAQPKRRSDLPHYIKTLYMDDALAKIKCGIFNHLLVVISGIVLYVAAVEVCTILYVFPVSQCDLNLTPSEKGILGGAAPFGIICSAHLFGYLADVKGRRAVILPTLIAAFFSSLFSSLAGSFYMLAIFRFLNGFFLSGSSATIYAYLGEFHGNAERSRAIMKSAAIFCTLCIFGPLIAWGVINQDWQFEVPLIGIIYKPWRLYFVAISLPEIFVAIILLFLPESPKFVLSQGNKMEAYEILKKVNRWNNGKKASLDQFELKEEPDSIEIKQRLVDCKKSRFPLLKSIWMQTAPLFKPPYLYSTLLISVFQFVSYASGHGFFMFFGQIMNQMAAYSNNDQMMMCKAINMQPANITSSQSELATVDGEVCTTKLELETLEQGIIVEIIFSVGQILIALIINKVGKFPIIFVTYFVCGVGGVVCMLTDIRIVQVYGLTVLVSSGLAMNVVQSQSVELFPTSLRAMAMSILLLFGRLGGIAGANVTALLLENQCETVFYLFGSSIMALAVLAFFIPNIHKKPSDVDKAQTRASMVSFRSGVN